MSLKIRFYGVRGSHPVPGPSTLRFGGNTSCVEVRADRRIIILDAGTGIIPLGKEIVRENGNRKEMLITLIFSHTHHDHTQGFPFFQPAYMPKCKLFMFGPRTFLEDLESTLEHAMISPFFPVQLKEMPALKTIRSINSSQVIILPSEDKAPELHNLHHDEFDIPRGAVVIRCLQSKAHPNGVMIYRIEQEGKSLVYATDVEGYVGGDTRLIDFARGTDLLIHDAQYEMDEYVGVGGTPHQSWGHSTPQMAAEVARKANVGRLVLFHHDPDHDDEKILQMEKEAKREFPKTIAAYEGLEITL
ncbi:TPA: MBL fold metallo-hydrolase [Candidatus Poribacteria bacterium]|nr:MBL fold metallo-hydrolase [Candidatus Poribacteria bacterium]HEX29779.1 MBL fold metallo-hydrolase [Candidatus Poribacteria bacterium]